MIDIEAIRREMEDAPRCVYNLRAIADKFKFREVGMGAHLLPSEIASIETSASELQQAKEFVDALLAEVESMFASSKDAATFELRLIERMIGLKIQALYPCDFYRYVEATIAEVERLRATETATYVLGITSENERLRAEVERLQRYEKGCICPTPGELPYDAACRRHGARALREALEGKATRP